MTEEQKYILITKMLDSPQSLSDLEIKFISDDPELREIYEISSAVSGACMPQPDLDMAEEWVRFRPRIMRKPWQMRWLLRVAAIFLGVVVMSAILVKVIDHAISVDNKPVVAQIEGSAEVDRQELTAMAPRTAEFQDEPIVAKATCKPYVSVGKRSNPDAEDIVKALPTDDIDIDEYLRIQQARVDNDLAMQTADIYEAELNRLMPLLDGLGVYSEDIDNNIRNVIMQ